MNAVKLNRTSDIKLFWLIVGIACIIRLGAVVWIGQSTRSWQAFSLDASSYHQIAQNLVERRIFTSSVDPPYDLGQPGTFRPPLTPFFLAAIYELVGVNLLWGRLGLAVLSSIACGLTWKLGKKFFGRTIGVIAAGVSCVYPFLLLLVLLPLTEGLSIFLSLLLMMMLYAYQPDNADRTETAEKQAYFSRSILVGLVFGLALLNKAANIVLLPSILVWAIFQVSGSWIMRIGRVMLIITAASLLILPWAVRNQHITGTFTPVNSNGGWTFYLGNNPHTGKNLDALEEGTSNGWIPPEDVFKPFADLEFDDTAHYEKRAIKLGLQFMWENPGMFIIYAFRKLNIFWSPYHHVLDKMTWYPLAGLSLFGLWHSLRSWRHHMLIYVLIISSMSIPVMFTSMPRFRAPLMPFLMIYAAYGLIKAGRIMGLMIDD